MPMSSPRFSQLLLSTQFVVWVIYGVLAGMGHWPVGRVWTACQCVSASAGGQPPHQGQAAGLGAVGLLRTGRDRDLRGQVGDFSYVQFGNHLVLYAGVSWGSILFGAPFTLQYARESATPEHWQSPGFIRANQIISRVWGMAFVLNIVLVAIALNPRDYPLLIGVGAPILTMVAASIFTSRYTRITRERAQRS